MVARAFALLALALALALAGCTSPPAEPVEPTAGGTGGTGSGAGNGTAPANTTVPGGAGANGTAPMVELAVSTSGQYPADPGFDPATLSVASGAMVHVTFTNAEVLPLFGHDWVVEGVTGADTDTAQPGASAEVTFTAPAPGEYVYFCSVPGHRERGMVGALTVT